MTVFWFEILGLKPINFIGFEPKFRSFKFWVSALLSSLLFLVYFNRPYGNSKDKSLQMFANVLAWLSNYGKTGDLPGFPIPTDPQQHYMCMSMKVFYHEKEKMAFHSRC